MKFTNEQAQQFLPEVKAIYDGAKSIYAIPQKIIAISKKVQEVNNVARWVLLALFVMGAIYYVSMDWNGAVTESMKVTANNVCALLFIYVLAGTIGGAVFNTERISNFVMKKASAYFAKEMARRYPTDVKARFNVYKTANLLNEWTDSDLMNFNCDTQTDLFWQEKLENFAQDCMAVGAWDYFETKKEVFFKKDLNNPKIAIGF